MHKNKTWAILGKLAFWIWSLVCLVIFMYFPGAISHMQGATLYDFSTLPEKLSRISIAKYFLDTLVAFFGMVFFGASCVSFGMRLAGIFHLDQAEINDTHPLRGVLLPTYFLIGNAAFSLIFLTLASLSNLSTVHSIIILSIGLLSGLAQFRKLPVPTVHFNTGSEKVVVALSVAILAVSLFQSSARISYDASSTYFSNAKLTVLERHAGYYLENTFVASIFHSVIQYSAVMQIFGDQSARMISWLFGVMNIAIAIALAELAGASMPARRILPALILTSTAFLDLMGDGKVDLLSSAYSLAAVYWVMKAGESRQSPSLYVFLGCFIGYACILRPHNVFLLGMFVFVHTIQQWRARRFHFVQIIRQAAWIVLGASGFALYHLLINKILLGSPFAFWTVVTNIDPVDGPWDFNPNAVWIYRLLYPAVVTFKNSGASLGNITPLVMAFLPTLAVMEFRKWITLQREAFQLYLSTGLVLFSWVILFFTVVEVRYVIFLWIILFIPIAEIIAGMLESDSASLRRMTISWTTLLLGFILIRSLYISISTYSPVDPQGDPQCSDSVLCDLFTTINETADRGERVLTLSAFRYYLRTDLFACSTRHDEYKTLQGLTTRNTEESWLEVYRQGYKYIAYEKGYATAHLQLKFIPSPDNTPDWIELEPIFGHPGDLWVAYRIKVAEPPITVKSVCKKNPSGMWEVQPLTATP